MQNFNKCRGAAFQRIKTRLLHCSGDVDLLAPVLLHLDDYLRVDEVISGQGCCYLFCELWDRQPLGFDRTEIREIDGALRWHLKVRSLCCLGPGKNRHRKDVSTAIGKRSGRSVEKLVNPSKADSRRTACTQRNQGRKLSGNRKANVLYCQLRNQASNLNAELLN